MAELKGLLDSAKRKIGGLIGGFNEYNDAFNDRAYSLLGNAPQQFNAGAAAGTAGSLGDAAYIARLPEYMLAGSMPDPRTIPGTSDYIAAQAGVPAPEGFLENAAWIGGQLLAPGPGEIGAAGMAGGKLAMFLGAKAKTAMPDVLEYAQAMEKAGKSADEIWQTTGKLGQPWMKGADGKWRFEVDDSTSSINGPLTVNARNNDIAKKFSHKAVFAAHPDAKKIAYVPANPDVTYNGRYQTKQQGGWWGENVSISNRDPDRKSITLHEIQHAMQEREGFARGGSPEDFLSSKTSTGLLPEADAAGGAFEAYRRLAGEAEARNVQSRMNMTMDERIALPPWLTQDVPTDQQIVRFGDGPAMSVIPGSAWDSPKLPSVDALARNVNKFLYHSGTADDVAGMKYGIEPTNEGPWIREILNGAVDDPEDIIETATPLAWMSDKPEWVKIKVARKLDKPLSEVTEADIAEHGHLAIINKKTAESAYRVGPEGLSNGEYSVVTNNKGEQLKAYETPLYGETRDFRKMEPFGVERNEWVSTDTVEPLVHLTGDELVQYLRKVEGRSEPLKAAEDFAARRAGKAKPYKEAMGMDQASRMARAKEMGFDTENPVYHGTRTKGDAIDAFDLEKAGSKTDAGYMGKGIYFGNDKTANVYAGHYEFDPGHFPEGGAVYPSYLALKSPLRLEDKIENGRSVDLELLARDALGLPRDATAEQVTQEALRQGYDGAIYSRGAGKYQEYVVYQPEKIRSKFAAFDPSKRDSANLLAGGAAAAVGLGAMREYNREKEYQ